MKTTLFTILISLLFYCPLLFGQGDSFKEFNVRDISGDTPQENSVHDSLVLWQERVVLQIDKKRVMPKEILFFKAYTLTGPKQLRVSASDILKVELLDEQGSLVKTQNHKISSGICDGSFEIPKNLKRGTYYLRAYTRWMLNYGVEQLPTQKILVGNFTPDTKKGQIEFYPESGSLVAGVENRLLMTIDENPSGDIHIVDEKNQSVSSVVKYGDNIYSTLFIPKKGSQYFLKYNEANKKRLPAIKENGYALQVNNIADDYFDVRIQKSPELEKEEITLKGWSGGIKYLETEVDFKGRSSIDIQIPKTDLPKGIFELALFNELEQQLAKRSLQVGNSELQIAIEPLIKESDEGVKSFSIKVRDGEGKPVATELSVSLQGHERILEPSGNESQPSSSENSRSHRYINDLLLLTDQLPINFGTISANDFPNEINYDFQNGLEFYGQAYDLDNKLITNSEVQILIKTDKDNIVKEVRTDSNGMLRLSGLQLDGEATMVFRRVAEDTKSKLVRVNPYKYKIPPLKTPSEEEATGSPKSQNLASVSPKTITKEFSSLEKEKGTIELDGVTLMEEKATRISNPSVYGVEPTRRVFQDLERPKTLPQLFMGIPGFQVTNMGGLNPTLIRPASMGIGPTLWVIDGFPLDQSSPRALGGAPISKLREVMDMLSYIDIERIEILGGANAAIYGSRAAGGVILIYTRTGGTEDYYARKDAQITFKGYHQSIDFQTYQEKYAKKNRRNEFSKTLFWNPTLKTNENGEASIKINLQDEAMKIRFEALAITQEGKTGRAIQVF